MVEMRKKRNVQLRKGRERKTEKYGMSGVKGEIKRGERDGNMLNGNKFRMKKTARLSLFICSIFSRSYVAGVMLQVTTHTYYSELYL